MSSIALLPLGGLEAAGAGSGLDVWSIALSGELGKLRLAVAIAALLAALSYALARSTVLACWGLAFTGIGAATLGLVGHAGGNLDHINAVNAMAVHLIAVAVWGGGLLVSEEHTSELQSRGHLVCRLLLEKKKK